MSEEKIKELSLEETFTEIENIMSQMSDESVSLEDTFGMYKDGMQMLSHCREVIDLVEKKVKMLSSEGEEEE